MVNNGDTLTAAELNTLIYTPAADATGSPLATFDFTVNDAGAGVVAAQMGVNVTAVNDIRGRDSQHRWPATVPKTPPILSAWRTLLLPTPKGDALVSARLSNLSLASGTLTHSGGTVVNNGDTLTAAELNTLIYTPAADATGSPLATFDFTVNDAGAGVVAAQMGVNVTAVNDAPTGNVTINNMTPAEGDTLTVSNTLVDADGLSGPISYQWYLDGVAIGGETGTTYTTVPADVGGVITVVASYTDDQGTFESVTSAATAAVTSVNNLPVIGGVTAGAVTEDVDPDTDGLLEAGGVLTVSDPDAGESSFQAGTVVGTYGSLTIDAAGNWNYAADNTHAAIQQLNAGENLTDVLTVSTADGTTHNVTISINGADDSPLADDSPGPVDEGGTDPDPEDDGDPIEPDPDEVPPTDDELPPPRGTRYP